MGLFKTSHHKLNGHFGFTHECENKLWKAIFDVCKQFICTRHIEMHAMLLSLVFFFSLNIIDFWCSGGDTEKLGILGTVRAYPEIPKTL